MADKQLEKISIVPADDGRHFRLTLSWMTGGSGRTAEMLPDLYETTDAAAARAREAYGVDPEPGDSAIDRHP